MIPIRSCCHRQRAGYSTPLWTICNGIRRHAHVSGEFASRRAGKAPRLGREKTKMLKVSRPYRNGQMSSPVLRKPDHSRRGTVGAARKCQLRRRSGSAGRGLGRQATSYGPLRRICLQSGGMLP
jgi:hypothetical protein